MATIPVGSLLFTGYAGGPVIFTDPDGAILTGPTVAPFSNATFTPNSLVVLDDGRYGSETDDTLTQVVQTRDTQVVETGNNSALALNPMVLSSDYTTAFWGLDTALRTPLSANQLLYKFDPDTAAVLATATISKSPDNDNDQLRNGCISPDGATFYQQGQRSSVGTIFSASATGGVATLLITETLLCAANDTPTQVFCLRNGELLVVWTTIATTDDTIVKHYSAAGATLHTYTISASGAGYYPNYIVPALDDLSFWVSLLHISSPFESVIKNILISDGSVLHSFNDTGLGTRAGRAPFVVVPVAIGAPPQPMLTFPNTPGEVGIPYSEGLVASGGTPPYGPYTITVGTLPYGLSLDAATGVISGIPTNVQTANFTAQVTDDNSQTADCLCSIAIGANMTIKSVGLIDPVLQFEDGDGLPYASGSVAFYAVGTSNLLDVYSDDDLATPLPNPVPLNAAGRSSTSITGVDTPVYCQQKTYDYSLFDADSVLVYGPITFSGSQWPGSIQGQSVMSPAANANAYANRFTTTINKAVSGTHALFAGTRFDIPTIGAAASTLTEAATVYIEGPPATGTNPYALHVASGTVKFDGPVVFAGNGGSFGNYRPVTANTNAVAGDRIVVTANTPTITLPAASANLNAFVVVLNNGTGLVTISPDGSDKVGLASSQTLNVATATAQGDSLTLVSDGISNWNIV